MTWFTVTTTIRSSAGTNVQFAFETEQASSLDEFAERLADGGIVGNRYKVITNEGVMEGPQPAMLTEAGVALVHLFETANRYQIVTRAERRDQHRREVRR